MKLILNKKNLSVNGSQILRSVGYNVFIDRKTGNESYSRRLGSGFYPKFHIYLYENIDKIIINLHLDQKQPSYSGSHAHNGEYDGEIIEKEIKRIKNLIGVI